MRRLLVSAAACVVLACGEPEEPGLCEGNGGRDVEVEAAYRFEDAPLSEDDLLPVFVPPQGGIATELDVVMGGVGFETLASLQIRAARVGDGTAVAEVHYAGGGLPLECVQDGELKVRAVPVPFLDGVTLDALDGVPVELTIRIDRRDGAVAQFAAVVTLDATQY